MGRRASHTPPYFLASPSRGIDEAACNLHAALLLLSFLKPNEAA